MDLTLRDDVTLKQAVQDAGVIDRELSEHGFDQAALEAAAKLGYVNSSFGVDSEDEVEMVDEFYPVETDKVSSSQQNDYQNGLASHNVTSIEQGLRQSVTAVS